jgi:hypothetical protein
MSTFSLTPLEFNPSSPRVVSYMNLTVLVQKTRCDIHGKPLWRRRLETGEDKDFFGEVFIQQ